jgi:hypothetical protein
MPDDSRQTSAAPEPEQAEPSVDESPFSKPKMAEIDPLPLLPWPWRRKKRAGKRRAAT